MTSSLLAEWDSFYVITGSSAGGLTGLTFVVIALAADARRVNPRGLASADVHRYSQRLGYRRVEQHA
jgi:hypothetical protein